MAVQTGLALVHDSSQQAWQTSISFPSELTLQGGQVLQASSAHKSLRANASFSTHELHVHLPGLGLVLPRLMTAAQAATEHIRNVSTVDQKAKLIS